MWLRRRGSSIVRRYRIERWCLRATSTRSSSRLARPWRLPSRTSPHGCSMPDATTPNKYNKHVSNGASNHSHRWPSRVPSPCCICCSTSTNGSSTRSRSHSTRPSECVRPCMTSGPSYYVKRPIKSSTSTPRLVRVSVPCWRSFGFVSSRPTSSRLTRR